MDPLKISAQFAAYVWYTKRLAVGRETEAAAFAKINWPRFRPLAHAGLGRLLNKIAAKNSGIRAKDQPHGPKLSRLKTLARALNKRVWPQAG